MKVSDEMIDAAVKAWNDSHIFDTTLAMRAAVEAAIAAWVKPTRAEAQAIRRAEKIANKELSKKSIAATARWAKVSPEDRRKNMEKAFTLRHEQMRSRA